MSKITAADGNGQPSNTIAAAVARHIAARHPAGLTASAFYSATAQYADNTASAGSVRLGIFLELPDELQASFYRSLALDGAS